MMLETRRIPIVVGEPTEGMQLGLAPGAVAMRVRKDGAEFSVAFTPQEAVQYGVELIQMAAMAAAAAANVAQAARLNGARKP